MRALAIAILVAACACSSSSAAVAPSATPVAQRSPSPATTALGPPPDGTVRYAVMQSDTGLDLVDEVTGRIAAHVDARPPAPSDSYLERNPLMSWTSESSDRLYYLVRGSEVDYVTSDGGKGVATTIALNSGDTAGFAVSPDDKRIAVSIMTWNGSYAGMKLYVEDLSGGGHHVDIFSGLTAEWPIGWVGGNLVIANGDCHWEWSPPNGCPHGNPYSATSYHIVDPATGIRRASVCGLATPPQGPVEPAGAICWGSAGPTQFVGWDGSVLAPPVAMPPHSDWSVALSPDGAQVMIGGTPITVLHGSSRSSLKVFGAATGWIDSAHVVVNVASSFELMDPTTGAGIVLPREVRYLGTLPAAIR